MMFWLTFFEMIHFHKIWTMFSVDDTVFLYNKHLFVV